MLATNVYFAPDNLMLIGCLLHLFSCIRNVLFESILFLVYDFLPKKSIPRDRILTFWPRTCLTPVPSVMRDYQRRHMWQLAARRRANRITWDENEDQMRSYYHNDYIR